MQLWQVLNAKKTISKYIRFSKLVAKFTPTNQHFLYSIGFNNTANITLKTENDKMRG